MRLFVCRHGQAQPSSASGRDFDRELTPLGVRQAAFIASEIESIGPRAPLVICSPYLRAVQTADPIAESLEADVCEDERLAVDTGIHSILSVIQHQYVQHMPSLVLVGHNPDLSDLVGVLLHGPHGGGVMNMATGMCLACTITQGDPVGSGAEPSILRLEEEG